MKNNLTLFALLLLNTISTIAQELSIDAEIRPRFEYRHGFNQPFPENTEPAAFVSQRTALKANYTAKKLTTFISLQDVSVWGDRPQLSATTGESFRVQEGWAKLGFGDGWGVKLGRQQLSYDDQRILGGLGWAQQARTHDAALLQYNKNGFKLDAGFSFNQNSEGIRGNVFASPNLDDAPGGPIFRYKAMQFLHLHKKWEGFSGSFLFMNNSFQDYAPNPVSGVSVEGTNSRQTTGVHLKYKSGAFGLSSNFYYQFGNIINDDIDVAAYLGAIDLTYKTGNTLLGLGFESISGDDNGTSDQKIEAFFPLFGTNHKFNGFMDYFYVANHPNSVGLNDFNAKAVFKTGEKSKLLVKGHYFTAASTPDNFDSNLGTEIDLVFTQKLNAYSTLNIGYSQAFLQDDFKALRGITEVATATTQASAETNNWGWVMLTIKPNLIKWKKPVPAETE